MVEITFIKIEGSILIFEDENGAVLCVRIKSKKEEVEHLVHEAETMEFLNSKNIQEKQIELSPVPIRNKW